MSDNTMFRPIRGLEEDLMKVAHTEGALLMATDTGKMWMDTPRERVPLGGTGAALLYAQATVETLSDDNGNYYYGINQEDLEDESAKPQIDDLILNSDGAFYRITSIEDEILYCSRLAVSGTGGGTGDSTSGKAKAITLRISSELTELINGQDAIVTVLANSGLDEDGEILDTNIQVYWKLYVGNASTPYYENQINVQTGVSKELNIGKYLRESTTSRIEIYAHGANSGDTRIRTLSFTTANLKLYESTQTIKPYALQQSSFRIYCTVEGNINKLLVYSIDGEEYEVELDSDTYGEQSYQVSGLSHGVHTLSINLYQYNNNTRIASVDPIEFEFAVDAGGTDPIIWLGDYKEEYHTYDAIRIPYRVYIPNQSVYNVTLLKDISVIGSREIDKSNTAFSIWEITDAEQNIRNSYTIQVEKTTALAEGESKYVSREINFVITEDTSRANFKLQNEDTLLLAFDSAGRSNNETEQSRQTWSYGDYKGTFSNFNWYNNGWIVDDDNSSTLRISNGAQFSIDLGSLIFNSPTQQINQSKTFEFQFKIRNVQDYSNLIKTYTRYSGDDVYWTAFEAQMNDSNGYDNYDSYLQYICSQPDAEKSYDDLTSGSTTVIRKISGNISFCDYRDSANRGIGLGPQDGFFATPQTTLSVNYVEDKMINLSIVYDYTNKNILIYLQGILTAIAAITDTQAFNINTSSIVFKSDYCDIDLYKFRVYSSALSVQNILINYATDHRDVLTYDHSTELLTYNEDTGEFQLDYYKVRNWNEDEDRIDEQLMPYVIFETSSSGDALPYSKANDKKIIFTFVNTGLERAYQNGELEELAAAMSASQQAAAIKEFPNDELALVKYYYKHHCPSFTSIEQKVNLAVQGTSSEFYPRRNYKAKTKGTKTVLNSDGTTSEEDNIYMYMNQGPFADTFSSGNYDDCQLDFFYFNNYSVGTTKFTMKIDFMESSGTYNMGMGNLVHTAYTKHPLDDYNSKEAFASASYEIATEEEADSKMTYYVDAKGSTKASFTEEEPYEANKYYKPVYSTKTISNTGDLRTNIQGFPVMAFWKYGSSDSDYRFIGRYNMLLDKGSDEAYGFKPSKSITAKFGKTKKGVQQIVRKIAECWEYSDNQHTFCSFRDPANHHKLSFDYRVDGERVYNAVGSCPVVADSFEYRYNTNEDLLDYLYNPSSTKGQSIKQDLIDSGDYTSAYLDMNNNKEQMADDMLDIYKNWEKACQWVWSTNTDNVPSEEDRQNGATARLIMNYKSAEGLEYDENTQYYDKYEDEVAAEDVVKEDNIVGAGMYIGEAAPVTWGSVTYKYETKEYRRAKFTYELEEHFDLEYCLVYFVMTEALLAYDSRGKNCMMASWGPLTEGGEYIWYPIFYDMDTQLGINNTGIPSFEYSENATQDGTFSTNDSILWNNLYTCFFDAITAKYAQLSSEMSTARTQYGPLYHSNINHIENWYLANPDETGELEMKGDRPLAMFNMDEWYKYISICNSKIGYQGQQADQILTNAKTFYYALQGDRSLSRQQFLSRRLTFLDSWLAVNGYSRSGGGSAVIRGRYGFNNPSLYSDKWVALEGGATGDLEYSPYYVEGELDERGYAKKTNYLDGDLFVDLTPYQKSYVTMGTDTEAWTPTQEYENKAVHYMFPAAQQESVKNGTGVSEGLIYIYGASALKDIGDVSRLYWSEFNSTNSPHLSRLLLGNDHPDFYNKNLEAGAELGAGSSDGIGKPLLKEINLSRVEFRDTNSKNIDTTSSEKLNIFKAVNSNIATVNFADGVALHTLYLPRTVTDLTLTEADNLTNIITSLGTFNENNYTNEETNTYYSTYYPTTDEWIAKQGLYIEGITDVENEASSSNSISTINLNGGSLGYGSFDILNKLYNKYKDGSSKLRVSMKKVNWSPYKQLEVDEIYSVDTTYYLDDGHYGFTEYSYSSEAQWLLDLTNGLVYKYIETEAENASKINNIEMLLDFVATNDSNKTFIDPTTEDETKPYTPTLTGTIYVDNDEAIDESVIRNTLFNSETGFSENNLDIKFKNVTKRYKATFIQEEDGVIVNKYGTQVIESGQFTSPYDLYEAKKDNYDFHGWSVSTSTDDIIAAEDWSTDSRTAAIEGTIDYKFYALFTKHEFAVQFKSGTVAIGFTDEISDSTATKIDGIEVQGISVTYGETVVEPVILPYLDDSTLAETERYTFIGWTQDRTATVVTSRNRAKLVDVSTIKVTSDMIFYAVFIQESVYNSVLDDKYLTYKLLNNGYAVSLNKYDETSNPTGIKPEELKGKITIPATYKGLPVISLTTTAENSLATSGAFSYCTELTHVFFEEGCEITTFGNHCFRNNTKLKKVELPDSLTRINDYCFASCSSLEMTKFAGNIQYIGSRALSSAGTKTTVDLVFGPNVTTMGTGVVQQSSWTVNSITFGTPEKGSNLNNIVISSNDTRPFAIYLSGSPQMTVGSVIFYGTTTTDLDTFKQYVETDRKIIGPWDRVTTIGTTFSYLLATES